MRSSANRLNAITRIMIALAFLIALSPAASAYTIVLLGGRHIQIPDQFTVTQSSLTYNVGPTISATILMAAVDVSATERANNENPGSLLRRVKASGLSAALAQSPARPPKPRTITNENLKGYAQVRRASEAAYEKRRIELGLPSLEDSKRQAAEAAESLDQFLTERHASEQQTREYWQHSADSLRSELASLDAQINFVRLRLGEHPGNPLIGLPLIASGLSFSSGGRAGVFSGANIGPRPSTFIAPGPANRIGLVPSGGARRMIGGPVAAPSSTRRFGRRISTAPIFGSLATTADFGYEYPALVEELDRLLEVRVGLEASQRQLEDEARRAGVDPGWLRPQ